MAKIGAKIRPQQAKVKANFEAVLSNGLSATVVIDVIFFAERSLVSHAELATPNSKRTPSRRCAVTAVSGNQRGLVRVRESPKLE